ncbi:MAG TPA: alpha/beta fold hydrolase [Solirubrobacteraceae bacterium]|nr:alpha/beta fold hydrolase [Solirubrobacteraceae bacterium]
MSLPETRYARSGELNIAYQVLGDGPFDLVFVPGFASHLDLQLGMPIVHEFFQRLASFSRLILFDKRGTGLSDPVAGPAPLEERMDDLRAVMDAAGSERAAVIGVSEGGPLAILFAASYPERVSALALCGTFACGNPDPEDNPAGARWLQAVTAFGETTQEWGTGKTLALFAPGYKGLMASVSLAAFERSCSSPRMLEAIGAMILETDVRDILPTIGVPTLVVHREHEFIPVEGARYIASHIPGARLAVLPGADHVPWVGDSEGYLDEIQEFLTGAFAEQAPGRVLSTVLFTDIVSSTEQASELGDRRWRELLEEHYSLVRELLERFRGREVNTTGDGLLATFDGPARAIRCGQALIKRLARSGVPIRAGIHTGECEVIGDDLAGIAVHIGARVAALGGPGELLVSSTVKDLVVGSGIRFQSNGEHELKGVPERWIVYRVLGDDETDSAARMPVEDERKTRMMDRALLATLRRNPHLTRRVFKRVRA